MARYSKARQGEVLQDLAQEGKGVIKAKVMATTRVPLGSVKAITGEERKRKARQDHT
jgi:hypothetical protein